MSCNNKCNTRLSPFQKRKYFGKNNRKTKEKTKQKKKQGHNEYSKSFIVI